MSSLDISREVEELTKRVQTLLDKVHTDRSDEQIILDILAQAPAPSFNKLLASIDFSQLISSIDDRMMGPKNRTALLELLTVTRLCDIDNDNRIALVDAVQRRWHGAKELQHCVKDVVLGTLGTHLTDLKNVIDNNYDNYDTQKLVFEFVKDADVRTTILEHIAAQAAKTVCKEVKVLSDIDDTLYCNLFDKRYPKGCTYPGCIALYKEVDIGPDEDGREGDVVFVTARPDIPGGLVEKKTKKAIRERGIERHTVLTGSFGHLVGDRIAERKFQNFQEFAQLYPEYGYVFFGDSGQADALFGMRMLQSGKRVPAVFIHDVVPATTPEEMAKRRPYKESGVFYHNTYVGAAVRALELGLISKGGLSRVMSAARSELPAVPFASVDAEKAMRELFEVDFAAAEAALAAGGAAASL